MYGSNPLCLLAMSILLLASVMLNGQSDRRTLSPEFERPLSPRIVQPPTVDSFRIHIPATTPRGTVGFPLIARAAGTIFSGTVIAVARRPPPHGQSLETVVITFHIENSIRGATPGRDLTISQWIGLWSGGQRYRVGERVLLFLYPPSKLGLTSSVGGEMGRFTVDVWGRVLLSAQHLSAFRADPVLGGKSRVTLSDFAMAVRQATLEE
jgi:hypothetical protein